MIKFLPLFLLSIFSTKFWKSSTYGLRLVSLYSKTRKIIFFTDFLIYLSIKPFIFLSKLIILIVSSSLHNFSSVGTSAVLNDSSLSTFIGTHTIPKENFKTILDRTSNYYIFAWKIRNLFSDGCKKDSWASDSFLLWLRYRDEDSNIES